MWDMLYGYICSPLSSLLRNCLTAVAMRHHPLYIAKAAAPATATAIAPPTAAPREALFGVDEGAAAVAEELNPHRDKR